MDGGRMACNCGVFFVFLSFCFRFDLLAISTYFEPADFPKTRSLRVFDFTKVEL